MSYEKMLTKIPRDLVSFVTEEVLQEAEALTLNHLRPGNKRATKGEIARKVEEAQRYLMEDIGKFLSDQMHFTPQGVLTLRRRYVVAWAIAQILKGLRPDGEQQPASD